MTEEFDSSDQLFEKISEDIERSQRQILSILLSDTEKTIKTSSGGKLVPESMIVDDKFISVINKIPGDDDGEIARRIEDNTQAFATAHKNLQNQSYVIELLNKEMPE